MFFFIQDYGYISEEVNFVWCGFSFKGFVQREQKSLTIQEKTKNTRGTRNSLNFRCPKVFLLVKEVIVITLDTSLSQLCSMVFIHFNIIQLCMKKAICMPLFGLASCKMKCSLLLLKYDIC